jgi:hypothetical protein
VNGPFVAAILGAVRSVGHVKCVGRNRSAQHSSDRQSAFRIADRVSGSGCVSGHTRIVDDDGLKGIADFVAFHDAVESAGQPDAGPNGFGEIVLVVIETSGLFTT